MYVLGILSILQMMFLPGFLLLRVLRLRPGHAASLLASIPLSLTINHFLVIALVLLHAYRPVAMYAVIAMEILAFGAIATRGRSHEEAVAASGLEKLSVLRDTLSSQGTLTAITWWTFLFGAVVVLLIHVSLAVQNVGTVFDTWDAVVSWNRWAVSWAGNSFPEQTWRYPQLLPANISIAYVMTRSSSVQLFAKAAMGIFPVAQLLMLAELGVRRRNPGYLAALALLGTMNFLAHSLYLAAGYADLPVAFMIMGSIYLLVIARGALPRERVLWLGLSVACGAGAALTKQAGLLWAAVIPILAVLEWRRLTPKDAAESCPSSRRRRTMRLLGAYAALSLALVTPWYAYKTWQIHTGRDGDERGAIALVNSPRATHLYETLARDTSGVLVNVFLTLAGIGALLSSRWRWPLLLYGAPYVVLCSILTNYDLRNLASAWPVWFTAGGAGWADALARSPLRSVAGLRLPRGVPMVLGLALAAWAPRLFVGGRLSRSALSDLQLLKQRQIGLPSLNEALYAYDDDQKLQGKIVTNYQLLRHLPALGDLYVYDEFLDVDGFRRAVADPGTRYVLVPAAASMGGPRAAVGDLVEMELAAGRYRLILEAGPPWATYRLLQIEQRPSQ